MEVGDQIWKRHIDQLLAYRGQEHLEPVPVCERLEEASEAPATPATPASPQESTPDSEGEREDSTVMEQEQDSFLPSQESVPKGTPATRTF